jgi:hypothetical protein
LQHLWTVGDLETLNESLIEVIALYPRITGLKALQARIAIVRGDIAAIQECLSDEGSRESCARVLSSLGYHKESSQIWEGIVRQNPSDTHSLCNWISELSFVDASGALKYAESLPNAIKVTPEDEKNAEAILKHEIGSSRQYAGVDGSLDFGENMDPTKKKLKLKKKKTKRKPRLPKNYDPSIPYTPDPDRWLPKKAKLAKQMALKSVRGKKNQKVINVRGGHQGGAVVESSAANSVPGTSAKRPQPSTKKKPGAKPKGKKR